MSIEKNRWKVFSINNTIPKNLDSACQLCYNIHEDNFFFEVSHSVTLFSANMTDDKNG